MKREVHSRAIVVPCYNEEKRLSVQYLSALSNISKAKIYFVNDGSTDKTLDFLMKLNFAYPTEVINLPRNVGKANALFFGLMQAYRDGFEIIAQVDADGAISDEDLLIGFDILEKDSQYSVSIGARVLFAGSQVKRTNLRKWIGRAVATLICLITKLEIYDPQSPCKIYRATFFSAIEFDKLKTKWFGEVELLLKHRHNAHEDVAIKEWPLMHWQEVKGGHLSISSTFEVVLDLFRLFLVRH